MQIWVDADACPNVIKEILYRAARRRKVKVTLVSNQPLRVPSSKWISFIRVEEGPDVADRRIVEEMEEGDLVITNDIPLAAEVIEKKGHAVNPRGDMFDPDDIGARLSMREFMDELRGTGMDIGGPRHMNKQDRQAFANQLDRMLTKYL